MKAEDVKVDFEELKRERQKNFKERLWFIKYWVNYIKTHSDEEWSEQQRVLIDSQIKGAREIAKKSNKKTDRKLG
jgi:hypothetical protein